MPFPVKLRKFRRMHLRPVKSLQQVYNWLVIDVRRLQAAVHELQPIVDAYMSNVNEHKFTSHELQSTVYEHQLFVNIYQ